jgi:hypothetical protein
LLSINRLDELIARDSPSVDLMNRRSPKHPRPCSGPGCSNRVPVSIPTALPDTDRIDQWGVLAALAFLPGVSPPHRLVDEPAAGPSGEPPSIFHPPPA